ncbi:MAG: hypothetical protein IT369_00620 [Candidatus Latescibacteria bacterium]|nr:hypothetical protein [Candidatus Latescibacterota bacterium]
MKALEFWKAVTVDHSNLIERMVALLEGHGIHYCVIGGQAVNAYADPLVSLDLDLVVAAPQFEGLESLLVGEFTVERFPHSLNISLTESDLRIQVQTDPRYFDFPDRASQREILGKILPVACLEDVLQGKVWAALDPDRRASKRQKDLADIARLLETHPSLRPQVPAEILARLV